MQTVKTLTNESTSLYAAYTKLIERNVLNAKRAGATPEELEARNRSIIKARDMMPIRVAEAGVDDDEE
jgi:hypothetical protein